MLASNRYHWVLEGDIEACFDEISHPALMDRIRRRIGDKRVVALIKAFLCAGVLSEDGVTATPRWAHPKAASCRRCWPTSPCRSSTITSPRPGNATWPPEPSGATRRHHGHATYRLVRYADDFVVMVAGTEAHAEGPAR